MKCVIAFSCLLAVASAGYLNTPIALGAYDDGSYKGEFYNGNIGVYAGALGYAVTNPGTPAVAYNAPLVSAPHPIRVAHAYAAPLAYGYAHAAPLTLASEARLIDPVAIAAGAPLPTGDTVEVAAAKAAHLHAHAVAKGLAYGAPIAHAVAPIAPIAPLALASEARLIDPVAIAAGAPLPTGDTVEVAAAKAAHLHAHAVAKGLAYGAPIAHAVAPIAPIAPVALASEARLIDPVAIAAGAPLPTGDTVEVAAAKAFHHQAHVAAKTNHLLAKGHYLVKRSPVLLRSAIAAPIHSYGYSAYASPLAYSGYSGYGYGGHLGAYYG